MVFMPDETLYANFAWALYVYTGAAGGVVVGIFEARASNRAVEAEHWTVELEETGDEGSVFAVELPRTDAPAGEDPERTEPERSAAATRTDG